MERSDIFFYDLHKWPNSIDGTIIPAHPYTSLPLVFLLKHKFAYISTKSSLRNNRAE